MIRMHPRAKLVKFNPETQTFELNAGKGEPCQISRTQVLQLIAEASDALAASGTLPKQL